MAFKDRSPEIQKFIDRLTLRAYGESISSVLDKGTCLICKNTVGQFRDGPSYKEYTISGMCQKCQDEVFNG